MTRNRRTATVVTALALVAALAGCAPGAPAAPHVESGELPGTDVIALAGDEVGPAVERAVEQLPGIVEHTLDALEVPGAAVAVVQGGDTVYEGGFGVRLSGEPDPIDPETVFQIASLSKPLSATVVAKAVTDGIVEWETPVSTLMPDFALSDEYVTRTATIGDFFTHRSGLYTGAGDDLEDIGFDRATILDRLRLQPLDSFRSSYHYSNFGITAGAESVATAADTSWEHLADELIFEPVGMSATSARYEDLLARDNRAHLHTMIDGEIVPGPERNPDPQAPAGGVSSNVIDLAEWMKMLLADGAISGQEHIAPSALLPAVSAHSISSQTASASQRPAHYGYGFNVGSQPGGRVTLGHSGAFVLGAGTSFQAIPDLDLGIVVLTNAGPIGAAESIIAEFLDVVQFGEATRDWMEVFGAMAAQYYQPVGDLVGETAPGDAEPSLPLDAYAGVYHNPYFGDLTVRVEPSGLVAALGPDGGYMLPLEPWGDNVFSFAPTGENAPPGSLSSASFTAEDGTTTSVTLDFFDAQGLGTWTRNAGGASE